MSDPSSPLSSNTDKKKSKLARPLLFGCLGIFIITALFVGGVTIWLFNSGKEYISDEVRDAIVSEIEGSGLPDSQQAALRGEIDRITDGFKQGEINFEDLMRIVEGIEQSPALSIIKYYEAEGNPLERASITDEQRSAAMHTLRRFVYGVFEEKIPDTAVEDLLDPFVVESSRGKGLDDIEFRTDITDEEIFAALSQAQQMADGAGISNSNLSPDIAREVREVVDRILAGRE